MVSLQLYELTDDKAAEESVKLNDTEKQLEKVGTLTGQRQTTRATQYNQLTITCLLFQGQDVHPELLPRMDTTRDRAQGNRKGTGQKVTTQFTGNMFELE